MPQDTPPEVFSLAQIQHLMRVEFSRAHRYGYPIVCLVAAVDGLGMLRDELGYDVKEAVLDELIELLHAGTRGSDFLGRLPDDRFLIVVPHSVAGKVEILAQRLVADARELAITELDDRRITLSIGGSGMSEGETLFFDDLLLTAQKCQAEASGEGGDRYLFRAPQGAL
jgi:diguanylate cyclase (GGDEF)-like protein